MVKRQDARLMSLGNSILAHADDTIIAPQKIRLRCWNEVRLTERNKRHGGAIFVLRLLPCQRHCCRQDQSDNSKPRSVIHISSLRRPVRLAYSAFQNVVNEV